ncbi:MAG: hypothetical protein JWM76_2930 [Pseudonocardiales bacterium]|nr:hypothetical protein [Pseudonocardiales bacterium]
MPVTSVTKDAESLTMTVVADFDAPVRRLWDAYLDPRQLERFWCPRSFPAVFTRHDGCAGGRSEWVMTGPDGPTVINELTPTPVEGGTLLSLLVTYPDAEVRDMALATGMIDGMESSYIRLESVIG